MIKTDILKDLRTQKNITQKEVADFLCISTSAYGCYEQGRNQMDYETLIKLSEFFNVTIDYLIIGNPDNNLLLNKIESEHIKTLRSISEFNRGQIYRFAKGILMKDN
jgi:transcriptional regulator with XRE-family HTH domain